MAETVSTYTLRETCEILHKNAAQISRLVSRGIIKHVVPPGKLRGYYLKEDVDNLARETREFEERYRIPQ